MADNYENVESSDTYGDSDLDGGGGEQIASAVYLNEQLQQQQEVNDGKQNAVVLQPSSPPLNPEVGDMWIDTNIFPNVIYSWDGTQWNKATATEPNEVGTHSIVTIDNNIGAVQSGVDAVSSRTTVVEQFITDGDSIASKVTQSTIYTEDRDSAVSDGIDGLTENMKDEDWVKLNMPKMVTQSQLTQTATDITAHFQASGGVNLLKNSVGYAFSQTDGFLHWQLMSGAATKYIGDDCVAAGAGISIVDGVISQAVAAIAGKPFTLALRVDKGTAGSAYVKISDGITYHTEDLIDTQAYDYAFVHIDAWIPATNVLIIELGATGATGGAVFTEIMLNTGEYVKQWGFANGENYNTNVTFDINGIQVQSSVYDGYTVMSPQEFSGYYRNNQGNMQKVFSLNKDVTEVAKLNVTDAKAEITMGSIKAVYVNGGGYRGWAFVPST